MKGPAERSGKEEVYVVPVFNIVIDGIDRSRCPGDVVRDTSRKTAEDMFQLHVREDLCRFACLLETDESRLGKLCPCMLETFNVPAAHEERGLTSTRIRVWWNFDGRLCAARQEEVYQRACGGQSLNFGRVSWQGCSSSHHWSLTAFSRV